MFLKEIGCRKKTRKSKARVRYIKRKKEKRKESNKVQYTYTRLCVRLSEYSIFKIGIRPSSD